MESQQTILYLIMLCMMMIIVQLFCNCFMKNVSVMGGPISSRSNKRVVFEHEYEVYGTMRCGYTVKMCQHLQAIGKTFKFIDVTKNAGAYENVLKHFGVTRSGVPFTVHKPTNTYFIGFKEVV
jgi:glutaredoxin